MRKHLNGRHAEFLAEGDITGFGLRKCEHCPSCWSQRRLQRHMQECPAAAAAAAAVAAGGAAAAGGVAAAGGAAAVEGVVGVEDAAAGVAEEQAAVPAAVPAEAPEAAVPAEAPAVAPAAAPIEEPAAAPIEELAAAAAAVPVEALAVAEAGEGAAPNVAPVEAAAANAAPAVGAHPAATANVDLDAFSDHDQAELLAHHASLADSPEYPWSRLHAAAKAELLRNVEVLCNAYITTSSVETLFRLLSMPKVGLATDIRETRRRCRLLANGTRAEVLQLYESRRRCHHGPTGPAPPPPDYDSEELAPALSLAEARRVQRHMAEGHLRKAAGVVRGQSGVASMTPTVEAELRRLHPTGSPNPCGDVQGPHVQRLTSAAATEALDAVVRRLHPQTSAGISGWSPNLVLLCYNSRSPQQPFRKFLTLLAQQVRTGVAPGVVLLAAARLTPLQPDPTAPKIRPIANGEIFYKICTKFTYATQSTGRELLPCQLGVGSPGGVEPLVHLAHTHFEANRVQVEAAEPLFKHLYSLDLRNAFNEVDRGVMARAIRTHAPGFYRSFRWCYGGQTPLVVNDGGSVKIIPSSQGVRQGCVLASLFFSIALRNKLVRLQNLHQGAALRVAPSSYLDDIHVLSSSGELMPQMEELFAPAVEGARPADGLILRPDKCHHHVLQDLHTIHSEVGLRTLGSMVGTHTARRAFLLEKIERLKWRLQRLHTLPKQVGLRMLTQCFGREVAHLLRSMDTEDLEDELRRVDTILLGHAEVIRDNINGGFLSERTKRIYTLPQSLGGMGIISHMEIRPAARAAATEAACAQLSAMRMPMIGEADPDPDAEAGPPRLRSQGERTHAIHQQAAESLLATLTADERIAFCDNGSKVGSAWLDVNPCGNWLRLTDSQVIAAMSTRLLQPLPGAATVCPHCNAPIPHPLHQECCPAAPHHRQTRHTFVRDALARAATASSHQVSLEPAVSNNPTRRADLSISTGANGSRLLDVKIKCVLAADTLAARALRRAEYTAAHPAIPNVAGAAAVVNPPAAAVAAAAGVAPQAAVIAPPGAAHPGAHPADPPDAIAAVGVVPPAAAIAAAGGEPPAAAIAAVGVEPPAAGIAAAGAHPQAAAAAAAGVAPQAAVIAPPGAAHPGAHPADPPDAIAAVGVVPPAAAIAAAGGEPPAAAIAAVGVEPPAAGIAAAGAHPQAAAAAAAGVAPQAAVIAPPGAAHPGAHPADPPDAHPLRSAAWRDIAASLEVAAAECRRKYSQLNLQRPVSPFVISTGGTLDSESHAYIKELLPSGKERRALYIELSLSLIRGRARAYGAL